MFPVETSRIGTCTATLKVVEITSLPTGTALFVSPTNKKTSCWLRRMRFTYMARASGMPPVMFAFCLKNFTMACFQSMTRRTGRAMVVGRKSLSSGFLNAQGDTRGINQGNVALPTERQPLPTVRTWGLCIHNERGEDI